MIRSSGKVSLSEKVVLVLLAVYILASGAGLDVWRSGDL